MNDKKIKVCYILPKFNFEIDTHFFYLYDFINLAAKDLDLSLIIEKSKSNISFFKNIKNIYVQKFSWMPLRILENLFLVISMRAKGYDNFYVHYSYISAFNAGLVSRLSGARAFYWNCGLAWNFGRDFTLQIVLKIINYLVTGVESLKNGYAENYNISQNKIKIMPNWIGPERFSNVNTDEICKKYNLDKNKNYILFVHHLSERKGAHYIIPAAKEFVNSMEIDFLIAGSGPHEEKLKEGIRESGLKNVRLLGRIPNKDIPAIMKMSKIFFMPSEEEGFPRVLLEAMASGLPYAASDVGGVKEISAKEQQEFIYEVGDINSMSGGIKKILEDKNLYDNLKNSNFENVKKYNISEVIKKFKNLF